MTTDTYAAEQLLNGLDPASSTHRLFATMSERLGWTSAFLNRVNDPSHADLRDVHTMTAALEEARQLGKTITIAPDFDMDGITSGVLGYAALSELGFTVNLHMPDYRRGHDLTPQDITEINAAYPDTSVLLTCDGGINSASGLRAAASLGWQTLVTDHHQELEPGCVADIYVNPCRIDETYELRGICGAHVLYQVMLAYTQRYQPAKEFSIRWLQLFAGIGTVSDVMPLVRENRTLVRDSTSIARLLWTPTPVDALTRMPDPDLIDVDATIIMQLLHSEDDHHPAFVAAFEGFALVVKAFVKAGKLRERSDLDEGFYGFYLAPAMNSPRRIGTSVADCFAVFLPGDRQARLETMSQIVKNNEIRKELVRVHHEQLDLLDQPFAPYVWFSAAPPGMLGLLASRIMSSTALPTVVLRVPDPTQPQASTSGSARAPGWFDVIEQLQEQDGMFGIGHAQACGVRINPALAGGTDTMTLAGRLAARLEESAQTLLLSDLAVDPSNQPAALTIGHAPDADASLLEVDALIELVERIEELRPFGHDFKEPLIDVVLEPQRCTVRPLGSDGQHLRLTTPEGLACLWWNVGPELAQLLTNAVTEPASNPAGAGSPAPMLRLTTHLKINHWNGMARLQAIVRDTHLPTEQLPTEQPVQSCA